MVRHRRPALWSSTRRDGPIHLCGPFCAAAVLAAGGTAWRRTSPLVRLLHGLPPDVPAPADQHVPNAAPALSAGAQRCTSVPVTGLPRDSSRDVCPAPDRLDRLALGLGPAAWRRGLPTLSRDGR